MSHGESVPDMFEEKTHGGHASYVDIYLRGNIHVTVSVIGI